MEEQMRFAIEIRADFPSFHPLTPVPGTPLWDEAVEAGWLEVTDFSRFDWMTPVMSSKFLSRDEIAWQIFRMNKRFFRRPKWRPSASRGGGNATQVKPKGGPKDPLGRPIGAQRPSLASRMDPIFHPTPVG